MTSTTRLLKLAPLAIATTIAAGCDHADDLDVQTDDFDIEFRGGDYKTTPQKLNTGYLGEEDLPINHMPMVAGTDDEVEILDITAERCRDSAGATLAGTFSRALTGLPVDVPLSNKGKLRSMLVADTTDPSIVCTVRGGHWENTEWEIRAEYEIEGTVETIETDLRLVDVDKDEYGVPLYQFKVNYPRVNPEYAGEIEYHNTCDEDEDPENDMHSHHAYLLPNRSVQANGDFQDTPNTMYMACLSGAVGKAQNFGYSQYMGDGVHELATRMVRADYCGDGQPHTVAGTPIWLQDTMSIHGEETPVGPHDREAIWSVNAGRALCLDTQRLGGDDPVVCTPVGGGNPVPLPACDDQMSGEITTIVPTFIEITL